MAGWELIIGLDFSLFKMAAKMSDTYINYIDMNEYSVPDTA